MWTPPQNHWGGLWLIKKRCTDYFSVRGFGADFPSLIVRLNLNLMIPKLSSIWKVLVLTTSTWHHLLFINNYTPFAGKIKLNKSYLLRRSTKLSIDGL